jgi:hypothetical protein
VRGVGERRSGGDADDSAAEHYESHRGGGLETVDGVVTTRPKVRLSSEAICTVSVKL